MMTALVWTWQNLILHEHSLKKNKVHLALACGPAHVKVCISSSHHRSEMKYTYAFNHKRRSDVLCVVNLNNVKSLCFSLVQNCLNIIQDSGSQCIPKPNQIDSNRELCFIISSFCFTDLLIKVILFCVPCTRRPLQDWLIKLRKIFKECTRDPLQFDLLV